VKNIFGRRALITEVKQAKKFWCNTFEFICEAERRFLRKRKKEEAEEAQNKLLGQSINGKEQPTMMAET
jgi:hypothetical protein